jgi:hypothetical protein
VHDTGNVRIGKVVVPLLQNLKDRPRMFEMGAYPGVEYRILRISQRTGTKLLVPRQGLHMS